MIEGEKEVSERVLCVERPEPYRRDTAHHPVFVGERGAQHLDGESPFRTNERFNSGTTNHDAAVPRIKRQGRTRLLGLDVTESVNGALYEGKRKPVLQEIDDDGNGG